MGGLDRLDQLEDLAGIGIGILQSGAQLHSFGAQIAVAAAMTGRQAVFISVLEKLDEALC